MSFSFLQPLRGLLLAVVLVLSAAGRLAAQAPGWQWANSVGLSRSNSTAVDAAGNVYVTGTFYGTATFGTTTLTNVSGNFEDVFVTKLNRNGVYQWAVSAGGINDDFGIALAVDRTGDVVMTGSFSSPTITFGTITLTNAFTGSIGGSNDLFVAKLTPAGVWQWATRAGGSDTDSGNSVAVDGSGNILIVGTFGGPMITFGTTTLTNSGSIYADAFVAKLTPMGVWQWATSVGGSSTELGGGVAVDGNGNVLVSGSFNSPTITLGATTLTNAGGFDLFVAQLTSAGVWQWATQVGGGNYDRDGDIAVDGSDNVVITGGFASPTITCGATTLTNNVLGSDIFVAKLTSAGVWQWATSAGGNDSDSGSSVAIDSSGNMVVTGGFFSHAITFGATTLANNSVRSDIFVAKLTPAGVWQWATRAGGSDYENGSSLAVDGSGHVVVTGGFSSPVITFGATTLTNTNPGSSAIFIASLSGTTGLPDADNSPNQPRLTLSPNPAHTTVQLTGATGATATLLDGLGRAVGTAPVGPEGSATLDVRALAPGLYLLRAGRATRRLVVE